MFKRFFQIFTLILVVAGLSSCAAYDNLTKKVNVVSMGAYHAIIATNVPGYVAMPGSKEYYITEKPVFTMSGVSKITYKKDQQDRIWVVLELKPSTYKLAQSSKPKVPSGWVVYIEGELTSTVGVLDPTNQSFIFRVSNESVAQRIIARLLRQE